MIPHKANSAARGTKKYLALSDLPFPSLGEAVWRAFSPTGCHRESYLGPQLSPVRYLVGPHGLQLVSDVGGFQPEPQLWIVVVVLVVTEISGDTESGATQGWSQDGGLF